MGKREIVTRYWIDNAQYSFGELSLVEVRGYETATQFRPVEKAERRNKHLPNYGSISCGKDEVFESPQAAAQHWIAQKTSELEYAKRRTQEANQDLHRMQKFAKSLEDGGNHD